MNKKIFFELCRKGTAQSVLAALKLGADPNRSCDVNVCTPEGEYAGAEDVKPVMYAAQALRPDIIEVLVRAGADICAEDADGRTALSYPFCNGFYWEEDGEDYCIYDSDENLKGFQRAETECEENKVQETLKTLLKLGAKPSHADQNILFDVDFMTPQCSDLIAAAILEDGKLTDDNKQESRPSETATEHEHFTEMWPKRLF